MLPKKAVSLQLQTVNSPWDSPMANQMPLPPTLTPRLISREAAAAYVCVSPNTFDQMVKDGLMPRPKSLGARRKAYDVRELNHAIDILPSDGENICDKTWDDTRDAA